MADLYPDLPTLPQEWLVQGEDQPDYLDVPGIELDGTDLGTLLSNTHVHAGNGGRVAIIHHEGKRSITFAELADVSDRLASALAAMGIEAGMRVGIRSPNRPEGIISAIAIWKLGAVVVPMPQLARASELSFYFADTEPTAVVAYSGSDDIDMVIEQAHSAGISTVLTFGTDEVPAGAISWDESIARAHRWVRDSPLSLDSVAIVWHTGGTTGVPKGCYHTQRRFLLAGYSYAMATGSAPGQRWAAAAPIGHALGMIFHTIFTLLHGTTIVLVDRFAEPRQLLEAIAEHDVTTFAAITASWAFMLDALESGEAPKPTTLRTGYAMWQSSSSSDVVDGWNRRGITLLNNFGSTAFAMWVLIPRRGENVAPGSLGRPSPGYEVSVVDPRDGTPVPAGEIGRMRVRGPSGLTYWRLPEKQAADVSEGWTWVDDLIVDQGGGNYGYMGRTDFLISSAGNKIAPSEVELVLAAHPAVMEVTVVGVPDPLRQEAVAAAVVVAGREPDEELRKELQNLVKSELSPYKYPRVLTFVDALPRDHVGKVQHKLVLELITAAMEARP
jgi:2-aminobenzoate-CoA ligase